MTFFDPLKPDRPEFDAIDTDEAKTLNWSPPPTGFEDLVLPPTPPNPRPTRKMINTLIGANLVDDILLDSERRADERKAKWWRRLWAR